ncbi:putative spermidine/putrescine transport system ATP-binding protein [Roseibium hamelinense]|uniref:Putative spermidine/putrescine transport system ATP-binding protein n=1 Tax=Roseibium hamelinense TaxID=150831 RepID=A0A562TH90_9HYPH|nr:ABC transporter ATP-binding protein [Roseibium hamelinense]MTI43143.1 ABC transporter ATP-binding protein [Roseibium hamelinense]TWI92508.1 putative spermidine/putrescine transport system ATP-binding protein [Roseibium hamelinense]
MSGLQLVDIHKRFGSVAAVDNISLSVDEGTFVCLLGPSGCGKTTLLRMIAGLEDPTSGNILLQGRRLNDTPAHLRNLGMVFQSLALFPHLSVGENIAYPLRIRGKSKAACGERVRELLDMVQLPGVADRTITQLSGGQRQRIAIARALAVSPQLFLLDEPLSALDAKLREAMQVELRQLQQRLGITTIVVTHDQREAMTMSDQIVVMSNGKVEQMGAPIEAYRRPATPFVADFLGQANLIKVAAGEGGARFSGGTIPGLDVAGGEGALVSIRPEDIAVLPSETGPVKASVVFVREMGAIVEIYLDAGGERIVAHAAPKTHGDFKVGSTVSLSMPAEACVVFDGAGA